MKWIARYKIRKAISTHKQYQKEIMNYTKPKTISDWERYIEDSDNLWHEVGCEYRAIERLNKLLKKYQCK